MEFYLPEADTWLSLNSLTEARTGHSIVEVGDTIMVAGGNVKSTEVLVSTDWILSVELKESKWNSAEVSFPAGLLSGGFG